MTKTKSNLLAIFAFALLALLLIGYNAIKVGAQPSQVYSEATASATTTVAYLSYGTATSTFQFDSILTNSGKIPGMQPVDSIALYIQAAASTTGTQYTFIPQYSNNNIDWYSISSQGTASAQGAIALATTTSYTWTPGTVATTSMVINLPVVPALHERIVVSTGSGAAGAVYMEADLKQNPNNP